VRRKLAHGDFLGVNRDDSESQRALEAEFVFRAKQLRQVRITRAVGVDDKILETF